MVDSQPLTGAQQELYDWLADYIGSHRHSPSIRQMMEAMGLRSAIRAGTEMQALAMTTEASRQTFAGFRAGDVRGALDARDGSFGDYRTSIPDGL